MVGSKSKELPIFSGPILTVISFLTALLFSWIISPPIIKLVKIYSCISLISCLYCYLTDATICFRSFTLSMALSLRYFGLFFLSLPSSDPYLWLWDCWKSFHALLVLFKLKFLSCSRMSDGLLAWFPGEPTKNCGTGTLGLRASSFTSIFTGLSWNSAT